MKVILLKCEGIEPAILGTYLSFGITSIDDMEKYATDGFIRQDVLDRFEKRKTALVKAGLGEDKFLESIQYWIAIRTKLKVWKQIDTYRHATKLSESTMHRSWKNLLGENDFDNWEHQNKDHIKWLNEKIKEFLSDETSPERKKELEDIITDNLPDAYLQTRMVCLNAKTLRNMYLQRKNHKLKEWRDFCEWLKTLPYGDLITLEK